MQNNRKSLVISTYDDIRNPHYGGGGAIAVHELAKRLSHTYDVRVVSWKYGKKSAEKIEGVNYERFGWSFLSPKVAMFAYQLLLPFQVISRHYDIWLESFCPPFTTALLPLFTKRPVVGIVHMLAAEDMERKYKLPFHLIENFGVRKYHKIIVTSPLVKEKVKHINPASTITVISNGIEKVIERILPKENYLLFLGRIEVDQKGLDLLIPAFKKFCKASKKKYTLIIAGDGASGEMGKLQKIIQTSGISDAIQLVGKVSGEKKEKLLQKAACVIVSSRFETYSLVALEALAHGAPLVCFNIKGLSWIPEKIAKKVTAYNVTSLANAMTAIVSNRKVSGTMSKAGKAYAKDFTWDAIAAQYAAYINQVI